MHKLRIMHENYKTGHLYKTELITPNNEDKPTVVMSSHCVSVFENNAQWAH